MSRKRNSGATRRLVRRERAEAERRAERDRQRVLYGGKAKRWRRDVEPWHPRPREVQQVRRLWPEGGALSSDALPRLLMLVSTAAGVADVCSRVVSLS